MSTCGLEATAAVLRAHGLDEGVLEGLAEGEGEAQGANADGEGTGRGQKHQQEHQRLEGSVGDGGGQAGKEQGAGCQALGRGEEQHVHRPAAPAAPPLPSPPSIQVCGGRGHRLSFAAVRLRSPPTLAIITEDVW